MLNGTKLDAARQDHFSETAVPQHFWYQLQNTPRLKKKTLSPPFEVEEKRVIKKKDVVP